MVAIHECHERSDSNVPVIVTEVVPGAIKIGLTVRPL
jgi:hypothetical protein